MNPILAADSYKLGHINFQKEGVTQIYSNFTPRFNYHFLKDYPDADNKVLWFGLQAALKQVFVDYWQENFFNKPKEEVIKEAKDILQPYIGMTDLSHFEELHDLGYLPLCVKALPEGSLVDIGIPTFTMTNTHPNFAWLTNYLESFLTAQLWKSIVIATVARQFKLLSEKFAVETTGSTEGTEFQNHDFSYRGQSGTESAGATGAAFLISSMGTDNVPSLQFIQKYYNTDITKDPVAHSVLASEHSVSSLGIQSSLKETLVEKEEDYLNYILDKIPTGIFSYVSDTYDYWGFLENVLPLAKDKVMSREGKFVVRPDSGDPVEVLCGKAIPNLSYSRDLKTAAYQSVVMNRDINYFFNQEDENKSYEALFEFEDKFYKADVIFVYKTTGHLNYNKVENIKEYQLTAEEKGTVEYLYETFGGTTNELGYKVLDEHIGVIFGDSITYSKAKEILTRLKSKGFASTNVVFGIGAYSVSSHVSRDTLGMAFKATMAQLEDGSYLPIFKEPKTDSSKKSAKGFIKVIEKDDHFELLDNVSKEDEDTGSLKSVFLDGIFVNETDFETIRNTAYPKP